MSVLLSKLETKRCVGFGAQAVHVAARTDFAPDSTKWDGKCRRCRVCDAARVRSRRRQLVVA